MLQKSNEKLAMTSQFDLTRFYDVIIRNSGIPDPFDPEISIDNYKILRCDRNRQRGGVACYVKNGLKSDSHLPKKLFFLFVSFNESPLKMMKIFFYFTLKDLGHVEKTA